MGRRNRKKKGGRKKSGQDENGSDYVALTVLQGNLKMEAYYAAQRLHSTYWNDAGKLVECQTDQEKSKERMRWRSTIGTVLHSSFRIGRDVPNNLKEKMKTELEEMLQTLKTADCDHVIRKLQFLPDAYQLSLDRATIRKDPALVQLHQWLKQQTQTGFISRQETVSMVPPVVLSPAPADSLLDMCAAPGSKASQLLEDLGPNGCLVANDAATQRACMLAHQLKRITVMHNNPVVLITSCDAQHFPAVTQFDKILCDVPCSGDGTSRKNIGVWKTWSQTSALALHALQVQIAWKGISQLLKVGGVLCYSTCSFNPVENEAVVAELLRRANGSLELVECSLAGFKTRPGWPRWKVFAEDKSRRERVNAEKKNNAKMQQKRKDWAEKDDMGEDGRDSAKTGDGVADAPEGLTRADAEGATKVECNDAGDKAPRPEFEPASMDDAYLLEMAKKAGLQYFESLEEVPKNLERRVRASCFSPTEDEVKRFRLDRCIRCLPQDNDTGGFFVSLLRKLAPASAKDRKLEKSESEASSEKDRPEIKRARIDKEERTTSGIEEDGDDEEAIDDSAFEGIDEDNKPIHGQVKGNFLRDKSGKVNPELGKDDFVSVPDDILAPLIDFYGLLPSFPKDLYMTRAGGEAKVLYYIGRPVKNLIDMGMQKRVTVINSGLKGFMRNNKESEVSYRVCQEAVHFLLPHMTKRKFVVDLENFVRCLDSRTISIAAFSESFQEKVRPFAVGAFVVVLEGYEDRFDEKLILTMWRCRGDKVDGLVSKVEIEAIKSKLNAFEEFKSTIEAIEIEKKAEDGKEATGKE